MTSVSKTAGRRMSLGGLALLSAALAASVPARAQDPNVAGHVRSETGGKLKSFYEAVGFQPLWIRNGKVGPEADRLLSLIESADLDGLDPRSYDPDGVRDAIAAAGDGTGESLAKAELKLSKAFAAYVADVRRPHDDVGMKYLDESLEPQKIKPALIMRQAAIAPSFSDYVADEAWTSPIYARLRTALAEYRETWSRLPAVTVPAGPALKSGMKGERVALLRERLGLPEGTQFDKALLKKLAAFQGDHGLKADGIAGVATLAAVNRDPEYYERTIRLNMERARILPSPLVRHIVVDAAAQRLYMYQDGKLVDSMKVVVGKPEMPTPMLAGLMRYAVVNPYWNMPEDLVQRRVAKEIAKGASMRSLGFEALSDWSANPQILDPATIDWPAVANGTQQVRMRQLPGGSNAMGKMKFMFPNDLGIYLHDTPDKTLFKQDVRQFSAGCVRLEDAPRLAKWLFGKPLTTESDAPEQNVWLPAPMPVYLTYLTAAPAGETGIAFREDAYGRDTPGSLMASR
jgi:murein L,D-transpeptidase YcbB/YkuD